MMSSAPRSDVRASGSSPEDKRSGFANSKVDDVDEDVEEGSEEGAENEEDESRMKV